jgi:hypothetical protein
MLGTLSISGVIKMIVLQMRRDLLHLELKRPLLCQRDNDAWVWLYHRDERGVNA